MMKLKVIAFFLSLMMLIQVLPVQQIGRALGQNQWTEELPHGDECPSKCSLTFNHPFLPPHNFIEIGGFHSENKELAYIHFCEQIPHNHSSEIVVPPPDIFI